MRRSARLDPRRRAAQAATLALGLLASSDRARADPAIDYGPRHSATLNVLSIFGPGLALEYERYLPPRFSVMSGLGFRTTGGASYTTLTSSTTLELRFWLTRRALFRPIDDRAMVGPYVGLREDVSWTLVHNNDRRRLAGTAVEIAETPAIGYRFAWRWFAVTPSLGFTLTTQLDPRGRLAPLTYPAGKLGLTMGVVF